MDKPAVFATISVVKNRQKYELHTNDPKHAFEVFAKARKVDKRASMTFNYGLTATASSIAGRAGA